MVNLSTRLLSILCIEVLLFEATNWSALGAEFLREFALPPEDGSFVVNAFAKDESGTLWVGTDDGIVKFDGVEKTVYRPEGPGRYQVNALHCYRGETLLIGTETGFDEFDLADKSFTRYSLSDEGPGTLYASAVKCLCEDAAGMIWLGTQWSGLNRFDPRSKRFQHVPIPTKKFQTVAAIVASKVTPNTLWVATEYLGLLRFDSETRSFTDSQGELSRDSAPSGTSPVGVPHRPVPLPSKVFDVLEIDDGSLFYGSADGVWRCDSSLSQHVQAKQTAGGTIRRIATNGMGLLFLVTQKGFCTLSYDDGENFASAYVDRLRSLDGAHFTTVEWFPDTEEIWIGTRSGRFYYGNSLISWIRVFPFSGIATLRLDDTQRLWITSPRLGVQVWEIESSNYPELIPGTEEIAAASTVEDPHGDPCVQAPGATNSTYPVDTSNRPYVLMQKNPCVVQTIMTALRDPDGNYWAWSKNREKAGPLNDFYHGEPGFCEPEGAGFIVRIGLDLFQRRVDGLYKMRFDRTAPESEAAPALPEFHKISELLPVTVARSSLNELWLGVQDGIHILEAQDNSSRELTDPLITGRRVYALAADHRDRMWAVPAGRLVCFSASGDRLYGEQAHIHSALANPLVSKGGRIYFADRESLIELDAENFRPPPITSKRPLVSEIVVGEEPHSFRPGSPVDIRLPAKTPLSISFILPSFEPSDRTWYSFRTGDEWSRWQKARHTTLTNLPPGPFTFEVRARDGNHRIVEDTTTIQGTRVPTWAETKTGKALVVVAVLALFLAGSRWRSRELKKKNEAMQLQVENLLDREKTLLLESARDMAKVEFLEQERVRINHANRVAILSMLGGALAHELKQPLGGILLHCFAGQTHAVKDPPDLQGVKNALESIDSDCKRADAIITGIRHLSDNQQRVKFEPLDLREIVMQAIELTRGFAGRERVELEFIDSDSEHWMQGDPTQLTQLFSNLIINAVEALADCQTRQIQVHLGRSEDDDAIEVRVRDSGPGFDPDVEKKVFDPFFSTKKEGMGIGLPLCKTIVLNHHGEISISSREGLLSTEVAVTFAPHGDAAS